ncbi:MAG: PEP-CTERM sorting domain-containing protein [Pirellulales bacterium]|nr:PEP-CTERM sorting domain-containing protein [Pirellulales bacterium]
MPCPLAVTRVARRGGRLFFSADDGYVPGLRDLEPKTFAMAIPEPGTWTLLTTVGIGILVCGFLRRRPVARRRPGG